MTAVAVIEGGGAMRVDPRPISAEARKAYIEHVHQVVREIARRHAWSAGE